MEQPRAAWVKLSGVAMKEWHGRPARDHAQDERATTKRSGYLRLRTTNAYNERPWLLDQNIAFSC